ncbi:hypothetical protein BOX15_Mlig008712g2, partial [Macrostomum lignano]
MPSSADNKSSMVGTQQPLAIQCRGNLGCLLLAAGILLLILPLCSAEVSARQVKFCHMVNDSCYQRSECGSKLSLVRTLCRDLGKCQLELPNELEICLEHLNNLHKMEPGLECFCPKSIEPPSELTRCMNVWEYLFNHPCKLAAGRSAPGGVRLPVAPSTDVLTDTSKSSNSESSNNLKSNSSLASSAAAYLAKIRQLESEPLPDDGRGGSCLERRSRCFDNPTCAADARAFQDRCGFDDISKCPGQRAACLQSYEALRNHGLIPCTCLNYTRAERLQCDRIRRVYPGNVCLRFFNDAYNIGLLHPKSSKDPQQRIGASSPDDDRKSPDSEAVVKSSEGASVIHPSAFQLIKSANCFEVYQSCVRHFDCLQRFIALAQACEWMSGAGSCRDRALCLGQLEAFYAYADRFANDAATCGCPADDSDCQQMSDIFRPRCAYEPPSGTPVDCVQLVESCRASRSCQAKLVHYSHACDARNRAGELAACTPDQPLRCHRMRRLLLGSELTQRCSCGGDNGRKLASSRLWRRPLCLELRALLTEPICLRSELHHQVSGVSATDACGLARRHGFSTKSSPFLRLPISNATNSANIGFVKGYYRLCRCVDSSGTVCLPATVESRVNDHTEDDQPVRAPKPSASVSPPGLYLGLGFSPWQPLPSGDSSDYEWARAISQLLGRTTTPEAASDCPLVTKASGDDGVLLRLELPALSAIDSSEPTDSELRERRLHFCLRQLRLVALLVARQLPEVRLEPRLAKLRSALITYVKPPPPPPPPPSTSRFDRGGFDSSRLGQRGGTASGGGTVNGCGFCVAVATVHL